MTQSRKINSRWNKDLNVNSNTLKFLEYRILNKLEVASRQKRKPQKKKMDKLNQNRIINFRDPEDTIYKLKSRQRLGEDTWSTDF